MNWQLVGNIAGKHGRDGADPDYEAIAKRVVELVPAGKDGLDGRDADVQAVEKAVVADIASQIKDMVGEHVTAAVGLLREELAEVVKASVSAIPVPVNGKDGLHGIGLAGAVIDKEGRLLLTLSDGTIRELGAVIGRDGVKGEPGRDGLSPDDFDFEFDPDTRGLTIALKRDGAIVTSATKPLRGVPRFCGTFDSAKQYELGDMVIFGGSQWCCKAEATSAMPDLHTVDGKRDWVLSVQRGKQGSQGRDGQPGKPGKDGQVVKLGYDGKPYS